MLPKKRDRHHAHPAPLGQPAARGFSSFMSSREENIMVHDHKTEMQVLDLEEFERMAGGSMMETWKLMFEILSNVSKSRS
jgi:hypothetical protein